MAQPKPDVLSDLDSILASADTSASPWYTDLQDGERKYPPDRDLLQRILEVPIAAGHAEDQQSGRVAKALDAWVAHELRRALRKAGEATNLRDRYPMAAMGYVFLVRDNVFEERAFELLRDLLVRLRKPDGPFDATMLLVATWDDELQLRWVEDPAEKLKMPDFFCDILNAVMTNTPVDIHQELRRRRLGEEPQGGFPPSEDEITPEVGLADE